jgi:MFS family permease
MENNNNLHNGNNRGYLTIFRETFSNRNIMVLTATQTIFMFTAFLFWPYRSLYILELGATKELLGMLLMLETVSQLAFQLPGGILADRLGRRKVLIMSTLFRLGSPVILLFSTHWTHVAPSLILSSAGMMGMPALSALIAESIPPERRSSGFSAYRMVTSMPVIITSLLGGYLIDLYGVVPGVRMILISMIIVSAFSVFLRWRYLTETLKEDDPTDDMKKPGVLDMFKDLSVIPKPIWTMTAVAAISVFAMRIVMSFYVVYAIEVVGVTATQWGLIGTVVSLVTTLITMPGGYLADRIGKKSAIVTSRVLLSLSTLGFSFSRGFYPLGATRMLGGIANGLGGAMFGPAGGHMWQALVSDITPARERARIIGLMGTIQGIVSTPASWVGGYVYDNISPDLNFRLSFALDMVATLIFVLLFKEQRKISEGIQT